MNLDAINTALVAVGPVVAIGGGWKVACWFVGLGEPTPAPAMPKPPAPQGAIRARATITRPLPEPAVEGELLPARTRKELPR